ncbi:hypothetical protein, partial [Bacillus altitudinis]|uniref:hypothetical protein n=1 Tax=Bacillus altitudinis TaxID=293387 RepID=UPI001C930C72
HAAKSVGCTADMGVKFVMKASINRSVMKNGLMHVLICICEWCRDVFVWKENGKYGKEKEKNGVGCREVS